MLALAFAVRAAVALSGDFVLHPDEIMQYLEPAHRLVFGAGVTYWEYFYGARSWLVPGFVAGILLLFDAVGLGQPVWYVAGVKLAFSAISLAIPAGMYFFARRHFDETAARAALIAGAFWYELVGFAHKPMTEFVATAPIVALLALCVRPAAAAREQALWPAALLAVLATAIRLQYAPLALVLIAIVFARTPRPHAARARRGGVRPRRGRARRRRLGRRTLPFLHHQRALQPPARERCAPARAPRGSTSNGSRSPGRGSARRASRRRCCARGATGSCWR